MKQCHLVLNLAQHVVKLWNEFKVEEIAKQTFYMKCFTYMKKLYLDYACIICVYVIWHLLPHTDIICPVVSCDVSGRKSLIVLLYFLFILEWNKCMFHNISLSFVVTCCQVMSSHLIWSHLMTSPFLPHNLTWPPISHLFLLVYYDNPLLCFLMWFWKVSLFSVVILCQLIY